MTTSEVQTRPALAFVWVWLPGATEPVVAGRLTDHGPQVSFVYGQSYLARTDAIPLSLPDLPLRPGEMMPLSGEIAGCIADAAPDSWGRRVIERRLMVGPGGLSTLAYLLQSGSDRIGALDIQHTPDIYIPRHVDVVDIEDLLEATRRVEEGLPLADSLRRALIRASSAGGARPKALIGGTATGQLAKFPSVADTYPVIQAEFVAMELARHAEINAAPVSLRPVTGKQVLLVDRFDRTPEGHRRLLVSAQTLLRLRGPAGGADPYGSYTSLAQEIRTRFADPTDTMRELFSRITFNILTGNTDDHPKNHAAFWDGTTLTLTPAYDICPQRRLAGTAEQAMAFGPNGDHISQVTRAITHAPSYRLSIEEASAIVDHQIDIVRREWHVTCDRAELTRPQREALWGKTIPQPGRAGRPCARSAPSSLHPATPSDSLTKSAATPAYGLPPHLEQPPPRPSSQFGVDT